jgi:type II secretion system protein J
LKTGPGEVSSVSGFTLVELIISSALMSVILGSAYLCLQAGVSGQKLIDSRAERVQSARVALALMSADLRSAIPLSRQFEFVGMSRMLGEVEADNVDFATHNYTPRAAREGDVCEVSYFLDKDAKTGVISLWRRRDPTPDPEPLSGGSREQIAEGVQGLRFEFYDGWEWFDDWGDTEGGARSESSWLTPGNLSGMPEAVRITLSLGAGATEKTGAKEETSEPPVVLQTIVRLNLAGRSEQSGAGGSSGTRSSASGPRSAITADDFIAGSAHPKRSALNIQHPTSDFPHPINGRRMFSAFATQGRELAP